LRRQSVPSKAELIRTGQADPLDEQRFSVTTSFIKNIPDEVFFLPLFTVQCIAGFVTGEDL